jgi:hypothetical protein
MTDALDRLTDWFVDDILSMTDEEILQEAREDGLLVFVTCEICAGEGFIDRGHPNAPHPSSVEMCPECCGRRVVEKTAVRITLDDLL